MSGVTTSTNNGFHTLYCRNIYNQHCLLIYVPSQTFYKLSLTFLKLINNSSSLNTWQYLDIFDPSIDFYDFMSPFSFSSDWEDPHPRTPKTMFDHISKHRKVPKK